jgi:hypothetical protein
MSCYEHDDNLGRGVKTRKGIIYFLGLFEEIFLISLQIFPAIISNNFFYRILKMVKIFETPAPKVSGTANRYPIGNWI